MLKDGFENGLVVEKNNDGGDLYIQNTGGQTEV